jgi:hypothetical protein
VLTPLDYDLEQLDLWKKRSSAISVKAYHCHSREAVQPPA